MEQRPDLITLLENEKKYYLEQVKRINTALSAIKNGVISTSFKQTSSKRRIKWAKELIEIFNNIEPNVELSPADIKEVLRDRGITEVDLPSNKNVVYTTLARLTNKKKVLEKVETGLYRLKKVDSIHRVRINPYDLSQKE